MAEGKNSFVFYREWKAVFDELDNEQSGKLIKHILAYINDENPETKDMVVKMSFALIKVALKKDLLKYRSIVERNRINGSKGGRPKKPKKPSGLSGNPSKPKKADNDISKDISNNINNNIKSLEDRKAEFKKQVVAQLSEKYDAKLLQDFFIYWSEHSEGAKKMRWEKEKTFGLKSRLHTFWNNREKWKTKKDRL